MEYLKEEILRKILSNDNVEYKKYKTNVAIFFIFLPTIIILIGIIWANSICNISLSISTIMVVIIFIILSINLSLFYLEIRWFSFLKRKKNLFLKKETKIMNEILWGNRVIFKDERQRLTNALNSLNDLNEIFKSLEISFAIKDLEWYLKRIDDFYKKCNYSEEKYYHIGPPKKNK